MKLRTNVNRLIRLSVFGEVVSPLIGKFVYTISAQGSPVVLPSVGGITYNLRVGDAACGWEADHVEPGVSVENKEDDARFGQAANAAFNVLACVGNEGVVASGEAKGAKGVVTGKHGGIDHVLMDFKPEVLDRLMLGDKILVKAFGVGLKFLDCPDVTVMNLDPRFLDTMRLKKRDGKLHVPVTHVIPAALMGSGLGQTHAYSGDYDIQLFDEKSRKRYGLDSLRIGDLVAIMDADHSFGRIYRQGSVTVGIVVHTNCVSAGHGPGVTTLFTSSSGKIVPRVDSRANIAFFLRLRTDI